MFTIILSANPTLTRDEIMTYLKDNGIDTRPVFYLMSDLPPYRDFSKGDSFPIATQLAKRGVSLPTSAALTRDDVKFVCKTLLRCVNQDRRIS